MTQTAFCLRFEEHFTFQSFPLKTAQVLVRNLLADPDTNLTNVFAKADTINGANFKQDDRIDLRYLANNDSKFSCLGNSSIKGSSRDIRLWLDS